MSCRRQQKAIPNPRLGHGIFNHDLAAAQQPNIVFIGVLFHHETLMHAEKR